MQSVSTVLGIIIAAFAIIAVLGVAFVYFRGSADKATIESQGRLLATRKEEIDDLKRRVGVLEAENEHLNRAVRQVEGIGDLTALATLIKADTATILTRMGAA